MIDRCRCGAVQGFWSATDEYPFTRQGVMHSPLGCLRGEVQVFQLKDLYFKCTGFEFYGDDLRVLYHALMKVLNDDPEFAKTVPGLVLEMVPLHPAREYVPEVQKPRRHAGSQGVGTVARVYKDPAPPPWLPTSGNPKPPWEK